jgi:DNA-binding XRE family transcriptional regulator
MNTYKAHPAADGTWYVACHQVSGAMVVLKGVTEGQANKYAAVCNGEELKRQHPRPVYHRFGRFLRNRRIVLDMGLKEIAHVAGVTYTTVSTWETANRMPGLQHMPGICLAYQVTAEELHQVLSGGKANK